MDKASKRAKPSVPIMMRHLPTLQTLWANRSLNHGRKPEESTYSSLARTSHDPTTFSHSEKLRIVEAAERCTKPMNSNR